MRKCADSLPHEPNYRSFATTSPLLDQGDQYTTGSDHTRSSFSIETAQPKLDCSVLEKLQNKTILLGVLDLSTHEIETPEIVADRIRRALPFIDARQLVIAPDCGLKYLPRDVAFAKMQAMVAGAKLMREELSA